MLDIGGYVTSQSFVAQLAAFISALIGAILRVFLLGAP